MNDKLLKFVNQYLNVPNTGDNKVNKGQCVGLIEVWTDSLGLPHTWGNAKDLLNNADRNNFDVILNNPKDTNQFPLPGDIICYDATWGAGDGHTGVVVDATGTTLVIFEQNNPVDHAPTVNTRTNHGGVLGWMHPKVDLSTPVPEPTITDQTKLQTISDGEIEYQAVKSLLEDRKNAVTNEQAVINQLQADKESLSSQLTECQNKIPVPTPPMNIPIPSKVPRWIRVIFGDAV